uniref:Secreted protein n=1 Tax=Rhizophora mucronata TaxID=61149 RepID=A0A2P2NG26_RHIMU
MDCAILLLLLDVAILRLCHSTPEMDRPARRRCRAIRCGGFMVHTIALQLRISIPLTQVLTEPAEESGDSVG